MSAIRSGVTSFIAIRTKLKFLRRSHHEVRQTQLHLGLKNDYRELLRSSDARQCVIVQEVDNLDVDEVAAWLVKAGLAGMPESDLLRGFCGKCRSIGIDLSTAVAVIDTLHPVYEGRAFHWRADGAQANPLVEYGSTRSFGFRIYEATQLLRIQRRRTRSSLY